MKRIKQYLHEKEFDTMTLVDDRATKETIDRKTFSDTQKDLAKDKPTQIYEPRPLTPDDDIYEDIIEQFASAPTKPKYWFEEFGDYWSCSCGHINKGNHCKSCGLERELLRSLFILHKPSDTALTKVVPIEEDPKAPAYKEVTIPEETSLTVSKKKSTFNFKKKTIIAISACIVLIAVFGLAIYKHMAAPAMQYDKALQLMEDGKYDAAIEEFTDLGDYSDSADLIHECWLLMGDSYYESGEFTKAINAYETAVDLKEDKTIYEKIRLCHIGIGDKYFDEKAYEKALGAYGVAAEIAPGEDVQLKIHDTKFEYIKLNIADRDDQLEGYMADLMESGYPGIQAIYDEYYAWHTNIVANTAEADYETDISTVSRKDTVYFHVSLSGGEPNETLHLYYEVIWPDGHSEIYDLESGWKAGDKIAARFQYPIPLFGQEGTMTFSLYDYNTKENLGKDSVTFKN